MAEAKRKLAAILSADVAGYSRLMGADEEATVAALNACRAIFKDEIESRNGRVVDTAGDSVLAEFPSVVEAVRTAVEVQHALAHRNDGLPKDQQMLFRIGVNLGDVIEQDDGTIYGDGVNIAARLESLAEPGHVCISESAHMQVRNKLDVGFEDIGEHEVKNIADPVRTYRVLTDGSPATIPTYAGVIFGKRAGLIVAVSVVVLAIGGVAIWQGTRPPPAPPPETVAEPVDPVLAMPTGPSIAVLPFDNMSGDPEQDFFADGLTEEIITALTRFSNMHVISRNSTFAYKGQAMDTRTVAKELGAASVLEGSVRRVGETVRITAQLINGVSGVHLWADTYERAYTPANVFEIQDEVTGQVVANIADSHGVISRFNAKRTVRTPPEKLSSYECVLRTFEYHRSFANDPDALPKFIDVRACLERAVAEEPDYANAWTNLSSIYFYEHAYEYDPRPNAKQRQFDTAQRAVELDPQSASARAALADAYFHLADLESFHREADLAIALNPNDQDTLGLLGNSIAYTGEWEKGLKLVKKAIALGPNYPTWFHMAIAKYHFQKGEYESALEEFRKVKWDNWMGQLQMSYVNGALGRTADASEAVAKLQELWPGFTIETAREVYRSYNFQESYIERMAEGLRKAGLPEGAD